MANTQGKLAGKNVLITGASSGVGLATSQLMAAEGARIILNARNEARLNEVASTLENDPVVAAGDVGNANTAAAVVDMAIDAVGQIDVLVYSAGICQPRLLNDISVEEFEEHIRVNLTGNFLVAQAVALHMNAGAGGTIVNVASESAHLGMGYYIHYCASKAGVIGLTRAMAAELAPKVTVNAVSPGPIDTPMLDAEFEWFAGTSDVDAIRNEAMQRPPLKRFATPMEIAKAILYLAADATYATGSILKIDGGTTAV